MMTTNAERVRSAAARRREAGQADGADLDPGITATRARQERRRRHDHEDGSGQTAERRGAGRRARSSPAQSRCACRSSGEEAEHDQDHDRRKGVGGLDASARSGCHGVGWRTILRCRPSAPLYSSAHPGPSVPRASPPHPNGGDRHMSRPDGRGGSARSADGSPTLHAPAFGDHQSRRRRSAVQPLIQLKASPSATTLGRNPLSTPSTSTSRPAGSPRSWGRPAAASPRCST